MIASMDEFLVRELGYTNFLRKQNKELKRELRELKLIAFGYSLIIIILGCCSIYALKILGG